MTMSRLLTIEEAANYLTISTSAMRRLAHEGVVPAIRFGGTQRVVFRFSRESLDEWITREIDRQAPSPEDPIQ